MRVCVSKQKGSIYNGVILYFIPDHQGTFLFEQSEDGSVKQEHCTAAALNTLQTGGKGALAKLTLGYPPNTGGVEVLPIATRSNGA